MSPTTQLPRSWLELSAEVVLGPVVDLGQESIWEARPSTLWWATARKVDCRKAEWCYGTKRLLENP